MSQTSNRCAAHGTGAAVAVSPGRGSTWLALLAAIAALLAGCGTRGEPTTAAAALSGGTPTSVTTTPAELPTALSAAPPEGMNSVVVIGNAPGQRGSVILSTRADDPSGMMARGACLGSGKIAMVLGEDASRSVSWIPCTGRWTTPRLVGTSGAVPSGGRIAVDRGPFLVTAIACGQVTSWSVDVIGAGKIGMDPGMTSPAVSMPSCSEDPG